MIVLTLAVAIAALLLFALSTDAHALARLRARPSPATRRSRRIAAWGLLFAAFILAVVVRGWVFGPVLWIGIVMAAAGVVFLSLNLLPEKSRTHR